MLTNVILEIKDAIKYPGPRIINDKTTIHTVKEPTGQTDHLKHFR